MMRREAAWLTQTLKGFSAEELSPMLSVGSGTTSFRATFQPWIDEQVYRPLQARGIEVLHHEMTSGEGIDVVGDLGDPAVRERMKQLGVRAVLCLNVMEHVTDRAGLADALVAAIPTGGLLFVTVPSRFPFHADPIDTLFRPTPEQLTGLFSGVDVIQRGNVRCESLVRHWLSKPGKVNALRKMFNSTRPAATAAAGAQAQPEFGRPSLAETARMIVASTEITFAILQRKGPES